MFYLYLRRPTFLYIISMEEGLTNGALSCAPKDRVMMMKKKTMKKKHAFQWGDFDARDTGSTNQLDDCLSVLPTVLTIRSPSFNLEGEKTLSTLMRESYGVNVTTEKTGRQTDRRTQSERKSKP